MAELSSARGASLLDAVDHLLNRGAVLVGHTTLSLAGVDLVYLGLNLVLSSVETLEQAERRGNRPPAAGAMLPPPDGPRRGDIVELPDRAGSIQGSVAPVSSTPRESMSPPSASPQLVMPAGLPERTAVEPGERPEQGLARLVLALVDLLRQLLERQAVRRMEGATISEEEMERMGLALMALEDKMTEICAVFGLSADDLNLDLGPLGRLLDEQQ